MPVYQYRREDGSTFDIRQKFTDDPLKIDPVTGQHVVRVMQAAGVIFKGSGFYINDSKNASKSSTMSASKKDNESHAEGGAKASENGASESASPKTEAGKSESSKSESSVSTPAASDAAKPAPKASTSAAAD